MLIKLSANDVSRLNWFGIKPAVAAILSAPLINPLAQLVGRAALPDRIAHRLPLAHRHVDYRLENGESVRLLDPRRDTIARDIHWGGGRPTSPAERRKLRCIERLSESAATFLDIGAYAGFYALIAARANPDLSAIAYEIVPENYFLLERNIVENDLVGRVRAKLRGIGDKPGAVRLPATMGAASLMTSMSLGSRFDDGVAIPVTTLDAETRELNGPFLMKIDVEGFERQVFAGAAEFLTEYRPDVVCEILPGADEACRSIEAMVRPLGYRTFTFEDDAVAEHAELAPTPKLRDWLITARADIDSILA